MSAENALQTEKNLERKTNVEKSAPKRNIGGQ